MQLKVSELEHKVELEKSTRNRMEIQIGRLRETVERMNKEVEELRLKAQDDNEKERKLQNQLRDIKEDYILLQRKEIDVTQLKTVVDNKLLIAESENGILKKELEMANCRIDDFQIAIHSEISSDTDTVCCPGEVAKDIGYRFKKPEKAINENVAEASFKKTLITEIQKKPKIERDTIIQ